MSNRIFARKKKLLGIRHCKLEKKYLNEKSLMLAKRIERTIDTFCERKNFRFLFVTLVSLAFQSKYSRVHQKTCTHPFCLWLCEKHTRNAHLEIGNRFRKKPPPKIRLIFDGFGHAPNNQPKKIHSADIFDFVQRSMYNLYQRSLLLPSCNHHHQYRAPY